MSDDEITAAQARPRRRRRAWRGVLLAVVVLLVAGLLAFVVSPTPAALLIRRLFDRGAAQATQALAEGAPAADAVLDLAYREGDPDAKLDVYTPPGTSSALPTIIWTHGGAWLSGSRKDYVGYYQRLAAQGFTVVSLGYSLAPEHRYPTAVHQLNDAHAWLLANAERLHIDPERIVLAGDSAGAQLSAQLAALATNPAHAAELGISPALPVGSLRGVLLFCGIYYVPAMGASGGVTGWGIGRALWAYTGERDFRGSAQGRQMSSLFHLTADFPPTFITGGNGDGLTNPQSRPMAAKLSGLGVVVEPLFFADDHEPSLGHEYQFDLSLADARLAFDTAVTFAHRVTARP